MNIISYQESKPKKEISIDGMSAYQMCRWAALKEAVDLIGEKCEEKGVELTPDMLQPLQILHYVDTVTDTLYNQVLQNEKD